MQPILLRIVDFPDPEGPATDTKSPPLDCERRALDSVDLGVAERVDLVYVRELHDSHVHLLAGQATVVRGGVP